MFREKTLVPQGKYSLGLMLEYHKLTWGWVSLFFMYYYNNTSYRAHIMNALFGAYGFLWVLKSNMFYDVKFYFDPHYFHDKTTTLINAASVSIYFIFPYMAASNRSEITPVELQLAVANYVLGCFFHYGADAQKFYSLRNKKKLITDGFYSYIRHPNYFGEFLIWIGLTILSNPYHFLSYLPILWLYIATVCIGIPTKESSMEKYKEYKHWKKNTYSLIPGVY